MEAANELFPFFKPARKGGVVDLPNGSPKKATSHNAHSTLVQINQDNASEAITQSLVGKPAAKWMEFISNPRAYMCLICKLEHVKKRKEFLE